MLENLEKGRNGEDNNINECDKLDINYNNFGIKKGNNINLENLTMDTLIN